jgi:hypothetical protein
MHVKSSIADAKQDRRTVGMGTRRHVSSTPNYEASNCCPTRTLVPDLAPGQAYLADYLNPNPVASHGVIGLDQKIT